MGKKSKNNNLRSSINNLGEEEDFKKEKKPKMNTTYAIVFGVTIAVVAAITCVVLVAALDPFDMQPGGSKDVIPGGLEILNTYKIERRYFFQGLEFIEDPQQNRGLSLLYSEGWRGSSSLGVLQVD